VTGAPVDCATGAAVAVDPEVGPAATGLGVVVFLATFAAVTLTLIPGPFPVLVEKREGSRKEDKFIN
jgi:hypothetical protein